MLGWRDWHLSPEQLHRSPSGETTARQGVLAGEIHISPRAGLDVHHVEVAQRGATRLLGNRLDRRAVELRLGKLPGEPIRVRRCE